MENMYLWRGEVKAFEKSDGKCPTQNAGKLRKKATFVFMKGIWVFERKKARVFWLKLIGGPLWKRLENFENSNLYLGRGLFVYERKKKGHLTKTDGGLENAKNAICVYELEYVFIRGKVKRFLTTTDRGYPTTKAGQSRKKPLVFMKGNVCTWRGKVRVLDSNWWGVSDEKGWKITKTATCVYEGKYLFMNGGRKSFWLKLMGDALRQRLENYEKSNLCLWRGICVFERKKQGYFEKNWLGISYEKYWTFMNQAACMYEREYVHINSEQIALKTFFRAPLKVALFGFFEPLEFWRFLFCCVEVSSPGRGNEGTKGFPGFYFSILIWKKPTTWV